jgi:hypothetical protein
MENAPLPERLQCFDKMINYSLNRIGWYATEHNLTYEEVHKIFWAGLAAGRVFDVILVPRTFADGTTEVIPPRASV